MAAAINNKHRSLIARESSFLSIFLHLSLSFSIRYSEIYLASSNRARSVVLHFLSLSSMAVRFASFPGSIAYPFHPSASLPTVREVSY